MNEIYERVAGLAGTEAGSGEWVQITQDRVDGFADLTEDHQWIHMAGERADQGPFGGPIAHGFLTLSLFSTLSGHLFDSLEPISSMVINYGFDRIRFVSPVPVGSRIRIHGRYGEITPIDGGAQVALELTVEVEGSEKPAVVAVQLVRLYG